MTLKGIVIQLYEAFGSHNEFGVRVIDEEGHECDLYDLSKMAMEDSGDYILGRNRRNIRVIRVREDDGGAGPVVWTVKGPADA